MLGSGFLYFHNNSHHLVTAWHNCSGRNFVDKQPISKDGWVPSHMQIILPLVHPLEAHDGSEYGTFGFTTRLYFDSEEEQPIWLVDAEQGSRLDIAVLPLSRFNEHPELVGEADREDLVHLVQALIGHTAPQHISVVGRPTCFVAHKRPEFDARLEVADDVYAIGFPQAIAAGHGTAIWKRGSVASEPDLELQRRSAFLIDSATRPGLSGAPVVARFKNPSFDNAGRGRLHIAWGKAWFLWALFQPFGKGRRRSSAWSSLESRSDRAK